MLQGLCVIDHSMKYVNIYNLWGIASDLVIAWIRILINLVQFMVLPYSSFTFHYTIIDHVFRIVF